MPRVNLVIPFFFLSTIVVGAQGQPGSGSSDSVTVRPQRDVVLLNDCSRALITRDGSPRAIQTCRDAVVAADAAGPTAFAPRSARSFLRDVYMFAEQWSNAMAAYQSALGITKSSDATALNAGEIQAKIAIAQVNLEPHVQTRTSGRSGVGRVAP